MINIVNTKHVTLIIGSPNREALRCCLFKLDICSLYNIQSPYSTANFIKHLQKNSAFFHANFSKIKVNHYNKFSKHKLINDIKKDPNSNIIIFSVVPNRLKNFGEKLKRLANEHNKQIIICLFLNGMKQERLNYQITLSYLEKLNIGLSNYSNIYWVYNEFYHSDSKDFESERTWVMNLRTNETEYL